MGCRAVWAATMVQKEVSRVKFEVLDGGGAKRFSLTKNEKWVARLRAKHNTMKLCPRKEREEERRLPARFFGALKRSGKVRERRRAQEARKAAGSVD